MIPVIFCGNARIYDGIFLAAVSSARRTKQDVEFFIFTMDLSDQNKNFTAVTDDMAEKLDCAVKTFNPNNKVTKKDLTNEFKATFSGGKNMKNGYTPYAMLRLLMDLPGVMDGYDKTIYLDVDTMAVKDINLLYDIDVSEYEYGACRDFMGRHWINKNYCNSGVLLINLKKVREVGLFEKCRKLIYKRPFVMPDQTALHMSSKKRLYLDDKFNEQRDIKEETVIKHFCKGVKWLPIFRIYNVKQWERDKVRKSLNTTEFDGDYEFYDEFMKNDTTKDGQ